MIDTFSRLWCDISILRFFFSVLNAVRLLLYSNKIMMVFSLFEFILGIKRYSFLGFSYNHWYNKWIKSWFLQTFSKPSFFLLVGLGHTISSLAWPLRHLRLLWRYPPWDFFPRPKKTEHATQAALETVQLNRQLLRGRLGASLLFRKLRIGHARVLGSTRVS